MFTISGKNLYNNEHVAIKLVSLKNNRGCEILSLLTKCCDVKPTEAVGGRCPYIAIHWCILHTDDKGLIRLGPAVAYCWLSELAYRIYLAHMPATQTNLIF